MKHLAAVGSGWFCETFGRAVEPLWCEPEDDMRVAPDESTTEILAFHARARAAADLAFDELPLDVLGTAWSNRGANGCSPAQPPRFTAARRARARCEP